jgi:hypothetical protein
MTITRDGTSTDVLDRTRSRGSMHEHDASGTIVMFPLMSAVAAAEDGGMNDETRGTAAGWVGQEERSWTGLGAITVMLFTVVAYATVFGLVAMVGALRGLAAGQIDVVRSVLAPVLLAPAVAILLFVRRPRS